MYQMFFFAVTTKRDKSLFFFLNAGVFGQQDAACAHMSVNLHLSVAHWSTVVRHRRGLSGQRLPEALARTPDNKAGKHSMLQN